MTRRHFWTRFIGGAPVMAAMAVDVPRATQLQPVEPILTSRTLSRERLEALQALVNELVARENARNR